MVVHRDRVPSPPPDPPGPSGRPALPLAGVRQPRPRAGALRGGNLLTGLWLAAAAVAAVVPLGRVPTWLALHLLLLGAATTAILVWSEHFTAALLHLPARPPARRWAVLASANAGALLVLVGVPGRWPALTVAGAALVSAAVGWHGADLARGTRTVLAGRFGYLVWFFVAAAVAFLAGATVGTLLATGRTPGDHDRWHALHVHLGLLGWVALTVLGTQFTLWPTVLHTRIGARSRAAARWCLLLCAGGLAVAAGGLLTWTRAVVVLGLLLFGLGCAAALRPLVEAWRTRHAGGPAAVMLGAATGWLVLAVVADVVLVLASPEPAVYVDRLSRLVPPAAAGFVGQVLLGALTFLLPVVLGGGPLGARALSGWLARGWPVRVALLNLGALLLLAPVPALRVLGAVSVAGAAAAFLALVAVGLLRSRRSTPSAPSA